MKENIQRLSRANNGFRSESGYSLAEALVALAIIGMISLVAIPNFMQFMRSGKIKTSVRQFSSDLRGARQIAVAKNLQTKISFDLGAASGPNQKMTYRIYERRGTAPWTLITVDARGLPLNATRELEESVYFNTTSFVDSDDPTADKDVIFQPNGTLQNPAGNNDVVLKTFYNIPKSQFTIEISPSGAIRAN
jgi:Tfp pilus assembly protein FimT